MFGRKKTNCSTNAKNVEADMEATSSKMSKSSASKSSKCCSGKASSSAKARK